MSYGLSLVLISTGILMAGNGLIARRLLWETRRRAELARTLESRTREVAEVVHDLRNSLCSLELSSSLALEVLEEKGVLPGVHDLKRSVQIATESSRAHLESLASVFRGPPAEAASEIQSSNQTSRSELELSEVLSSVLAEVSPQLASFGKEGVDSTPVKPGLQLRCSGQESQTHCNLKAFRRILLNMILNAGEHSADSQKRIELQHSVVLTQSQEWFVLRISNPRKDPGFSMGAARALVCPPFKSVKWGSRERGLGMQICQRLAEESGFHYKAGVDPLDPSCFRAEVIVPVDRIETLVA